MKKNTDQVAHNLVEVTEMQHRKRTRKFPYDDVKQHVRMTQGGWESDKRS